MIPSAWAYFLPVCSNPSISAAGLAMTYIDGDQFCTLLKSPKKDQEYHLPGYRLWFPKVTHHLDSVLKEPIKDGLCILYTNSIFKNK